MQTDPFPRFDCLRGTSLRVAVALAAAQGQDVKEF